MESRSNTPHRCFNTPISEGIITNTTINTSTSMPTPLASPSITPPLRCQGLTPLTPPPFPQRPHHHTTTFILSTPTPLAITTSTPLLPPPRYQDHNHTMSYIIGTPLAPSPPPRSSSFVAVCHYIGSSSLPAGHLLLLNTTATTSLFAVPPSSLSVITIGFSRSPTGTSSPSTPPPPHSSQFLLRRCHYKP